MNETNTVVSPEVSAILSSVLIEYLWGLALAAQYRKYAIQKFSLWPAQLGGRNIQDIAHLDETRRVFGVDPVCCELHVINSKDHYQMVSAN